MVTLCKHSEAHYPVSHQRVSPPAERGLNLAAAQRPETLLHHLFTIMNERTFLAYVLLESGLSGAEKPELVRVALTRAFFCRGEVVCYF